MIFNFFPNNEFSIHTYWKKKTLWKGEIAYYEQFLLFPQCFQKTYTADTLKPGLVWERVNDPWKEDLKKIVRKCCFLLCQRRIALFYLHSNCHLQMP